MRLGRIYEVCWSRDNTWDGWWKNSISVLLLVRV